MNFTSLEFFLFFLSLLIYLNFSKNLKFQKYALLFSSYFFYGYWDYRFLSLIIFSSILDYIIGRKIYFAKSNLDAKFFLKMSLILNLGILGFFKYYNFFIESANFAFSNVGINLSTLNIILPVGISFYTFQSMSYSIDIYRKKLLPEKEIINFLIFVSFFPQLVAGPIVRAVDFLPQLKNDIKIKKNNIHIGLQIFIQGLIKKVIVADNLGYFVDHIFSAPEIYSSATIWLAVISYSVQIFCDFSGYSDMAIGIAKILGFNLPTNFNMPYVSTNITEFWRRWHISLSTWLRDYLYIALGGNRVSNMRQKFNLLVTMFLGGLWHGASWNFVLWGIIHGICLIIHKKITNIITFNNNVLISFLSWLITFLVVCFSWVFFRAESFNISITILKKMIIFDQGLLWIYTPIILIFILVIFSHFIGYRMKEDYLILDLNSFFGSFLLILSILCLFFFSSSNKNPFIYF